MLLLLVGLGSQVAKAVFFGSGSNVDLAFTASKTSVARSRPSSGRLLTRCWSRSLLPPAGWFRTRSSASANFEESFFEFLGRKCW